MIGNLTSCFSFISCFHTIIVLPNSFSHAAYLFEDKITAPLPFRYTKFFEFFLEGNTELYTVNFMFVTFWFNYFSASLKIGSWFPIRPCQSPSTIMFVIDFVLTKSNGLSLNDISPDMKDTFLFIFSFLVIIDRAW